MSISGKNGPALFVLGSFAVDLAGTTPRLPAPGETVVALSFHSGPGGKGSNQAVAAQRAGARVTFLTRLGNDGFADTAESLFAAEGIDASPTSRTPEHATGAALIMIDQISGQNMIAVAPGASGHIPLEGIDRAAGKIARSRLFLTQLETNIEPVLRGLEVAAAKGVPTILNPAPARPLPDGAYELIDYLTPNETELGALAGRPVKELDDVIEAGQALLAKGVRQAVIATLGERGVLILDRDRTPVLIPAYDMSAQKVIDTTGAGDAFSGAFATALAEGRSLDDAAEFGCAAAGLSVTRAGAALAMPRRAEIDALIEAQRGRRGV